MNLERLEQRLNEAVESGEISEREAREIWLEAEREAHYEY